MHAPSLIHRQPRPYADLRLFCLPYAGGNAAMYRTWHQELPDSIEVCPVEYPGHGTRMRERPLANIQTLAAQLAGELLPLLDKPFALFGHSMGAITSFELARALRDRYGRAPQHLVVSAHRAPHIPHPEPLTYDLPDDQFFERIVELNGTPREVLAQPELMELTLPILRADFAACDTYQYLEASPLACPITAYGGLHDPMVARAHMHVWRHHTEHACTSRMFPGEHFFISTARTLVLNNLAHVLDTCVDAPAV